MLLFHKLYNVGKTPVLGPVQVNDDALVGFPVGTLSGCHGGLCGSDDWRGAFAERDQVGVQRSLGSKRDEW